MSPLWRAEQRIGVCPDRLVLARSVVPVGADPVPELRKIAGNSRLTVILSNHFVRYAALPWSSALASEQEWLAYAEHTLRSTYGGACAGWQIRVSPAGRREPRLASAVDGALIESLRTLRGLVSIQPYLTAAFNVRRRAFGKDSGWLVVQEQGRVTFGLAANGSWSLVRSRQARGSLREALPDLLDGELAALAGTDCDRVYVCSEEELPPKLGRYLITDITLPRGASLDARSRAMALN